ncbi:mediator complex subunit MED14-domain-containing protein [Mycena polygramma]|nr:mediator complex subunit MED14-domain-containing protein [Mycena polygramma]
MDMEISPSAENGLVNGAYTNGFGQASLEELEQDLPIVYDGQVMLGDILSRVVQSIYAELSELAETMPNMSDSARKRTLADWVVKTKKQVVKLYAVVKWSRDADTVQKCMNITAFLMNQNQQFEDTMRGLNYAKESLDPARLRNHDLLTSLDVLTTGSYHGLPTGIKKMIIPPTPLTDSEVMKTLTDMEHAIRHRLRMHEIIPVEMAKHRIADGRVYFTVPNLFEASLCLRGGLREDGWFFVHVEFLITVGGDLTGIQDFPRTPTGLMKRHITDEADSQLAFYLPLPADHVPPPGATFPPRPQLADDVVDTPLVRVFNFLQMMSLSYQLEILWYQAERMRSLGWADYLSVKMSDNRKSFTASYWLRPPPPANARPRAKLPLLGGTLTISIVEAKHPSQIRGPARTPKARVLAELQHRSKLGTLRASDEVEGLKFEVRWEPAKGALGAVISSEIPDDFLVINATDLNFESLLKKVLEKHTHEILAIFQYQLQRGQPHSVFSGHGIVTLTMDEQLEVLRINLCADEVVMITLDSRSGRFNIRDTGDLAAAERGPRFKTLSDKINEDPTVLFNVLIRLRLITITDLAEQKAIYLGLQSFRRRNFMPDEMTKLGPAARGAVYIQLSNFPSHYLVLVINDKEFRYALITTRVLPGTMYGNLVMEDIAWLDFDRIHGGDIAITAHSDQPSRSAAGGAREVMDDMATEVVQAGFHLDTQVLRELYSYCCARVSYMNVERQFKIRGIPFTHVSPTLHETVTPELAHIQSSLARSVPALCVQSEHILSGAPAAEAAMPNIRVIPLNWWSDKNAQVVTCVKLKYVQQPMGKTAGTSSVIRPSKRIIYDTTEAVVSFVSENVNTCVDEFLEEWARVSKMVVIAREVAQMSKEQKWPDIRLLSFDLQTVAFAYASDYTVSISCEDQLSTGGNFDLRFSRCDPSLDNFNPHDDAEPFLRNILRHGHGRLAPSLHRLVAFLRETLPIAVELEEIRQQSQGAVDTFAKAAGWYRLLFGDSRHALDFRLMTNQRVLILDGSQSLFSTGPAQHAEGPTTDRGLLPIPRFSDIVLQVVQKMLSSGAALPGKIAPLDTGVICQTDIVRTLGRAIYTAVIEVN